MTSAELPDEPPAGTNRDTPLGTAGAFVAVTMWGLGNVLIASIPMNGLAIGTYRLGLGAIVFTAILYATGGRLSRRVFRLGWKGGFAFGLDIATFFLAVRNTSVAIAVTLSALQPVVIAGFAAVMFGEPIRRRHVVATSIAVPAVGLVAFAAGAGSPRSGFGDLMAAAALFAWAAYFITSKKAREELGTLEYMAVLNIGAFITVLALAVPTGALSAPDGRPSWSQLAAIVAVLALPGTGHVVMNWAHGHSTLMMTSLATLAMPIISTVAALVFLGQAVTGLQALGIAVVLVTLAAFVVAESRGPRLRHAGDHD